MKYADGTEVRVGDDVRLWRGTTGRVVCAIDSDEYSPAYPKSEWAYLGVGVLVLTRSHGLMHLPTADEDLECVTRGHGPR